MNLPFSPWPTWYLVLIAYTAILGLFALRRQSTIGAALKAQQRSSADPHQRGELAGQRVAGWIRSSGWLLAAGLLLTGRSWAITVVAAAYAISAERSYGPYAQGFAEGYKSVELACAPEYVHGRVVPRARDRAAALVYVVVTRLLPSAAALIAMSWIGR